MGITTRNHQSGVHLGRLDKVCKTFIGGSIPPRASKIFVNSYATAESECEATGFATRGSFTSITVPVLDVRSMATEPP